MKEEIWKQIEDFEGIYEISNLGKVRTWRKYLNKSSETVPRLLEPKIRSTPKRNKYKESATVVLYKRSLYTSFNITKNLPKYFPESQIAFQASKIREK